MHILDLLFIMLLIIGLGTGLIGVPLILYYAATGLDDDSKSPVGMKK